MHEDDRVSQPGGESVLPLVTRAKDGRGARHERRSRPRVPLAVEVTLTSETHFYAGLTGDVSSGGIFVSTYKPHPVGTRVAIELGLPDRMVHARGTVRWIREMAGNVAPGVGIAFEPLSDDARDSIEAFCKDRAPTYYDVE